MTPFVNGPEKNARFNNIPVVFARIYKPKRGYYVVETKLASLTPRDMKDGELTLQYVRYLKNDPVGVKRMVSFYIVSHHPGSACNSNDKKA